MALLCQVNLDKQIRKTQRRLIKNVFINVDQANTPTHVVSLQKEHLHVNSSERILLQADLHVHHISQNVHICPEKAIYYLPESSFLSQRI